MVTAFGEACWIPSGRENFYQIRGFFVVLRFYRVEKFSVNGWVFVDMSGMNGIGQATYFPSSCSSRHYPRSGPSSNGEKQGNSRWCRMSPLCSTASCGCSTELHLWLGSCWCWPSTLQEWWLNPFTSSSTFYLVILKVGKEQDVTFWE